MGQVQQVRSFNRLVTQRIGALDSGYLSTGRPLGEARLLWEIGPAGRDVRDLRARLGLDSGYLSRLLRSLEAAGLVSVAPSAADRRIRTARLTAKGRRRREQLDRRSDALARSILDPLSPAQRVRLTAAMREVERLLTAALVEIAPEDPEHPDARACMAAYVAELNERSEKGFDPAKGVTTLPHEVRPPAGRFLVARLHGEAIGCGAVKHVPGGPTDIKRMWVARSARGLGLGRRLLHALEQEAIGAGATAARLETGVELTEAIALYRAEGYVEVEPFNAEPFADLWFEKPLRRSGEGGIRTRDGAINPILA